MSLTLYDPFADLTQIRRHFNRLLEDSAPAPQTDAHNRIWAPPVDLFENEDGVTLKLDLPGVDRATLEVNLNQDELRISGTRPWQAPETGKCLHAERLHGQFHRSFRIGIPVQADRVEAAYQDGVLTVTVPKAEAARPRKVEVRVA